MGDLSVNLERTHLARLAVHQAPGSPIPIFQVLGLQAHSTVPAVLCGRQGSDSGPYACAESLLPTDPSPQPQKPLLFLEQQRTAVNVTHGYR